MNSRTSTLIGGMMVVLVLSIAPTASGQYRGRDYDRDRFTRVEPGTIVAVRTNENIDVERRDNRVYSGIVDQEMSGDNGRLANPGGSRLELFVRVAPDNDMIL